tara:strand:- start:1020 stop:2030 length:1011 start_codon:yes stop_codon:yes gene_type:complete
VNIDQIIKKKNLFIIAEAGNNHEGNFDRAVKMIYSASECGADAIKFQTFKTKNFVSNLYKKKSINKLKNFELTYNQFHKLSQIAKKKNIIFISTPLDIESAFFLNKIQNVFKIASGDNDFYDLIDLIISFNKKTIISTGITDIENLKKIHRKFKAKFKKNIKKKLSFLHCVTDYPVPNEFINLNSILYLKEKFPEIDIGYSDHSLGNLACLGAATMGAKILEKHFTLDKNLSSFRDHKLSADPKELKNLIIDAHKITKAKGKYGKFILPNEKKNLLVAKRSYFLTQDLFKDDKLTKKKLIMLRPRKKFSYINEIIGKKINQNLKKGKMIKKKYLYD